jgi:hypothetical protein
MSFAVKVLPLAVVATALIAACSDVSSPNSAISVNGSAVASKGGSGGGGGNGGGTTTQPVLTTPATVNVTGKWVATTDGPDILHTYTYLLTQASAGTVSGTMSWVAGGSNGFALVTGTVNGDTLALYEGPGTVCAGCQLTPTFRGIVSSNGSRIDGSFMVGGSPLRFIKQ